MTEQKTLKITPQTHKLLEEMKIELTPKLKDPNLTFDKVITYLIEHYKKHQKKE
ncbi:MAG: hypothetical protein QXH20_04975 [Candidatus Bathyarchaeia archaeon]